MNAYELADLMLDVTDMETSEYYQAGMMLRQQADRIAELEKEIGVQAWLSQTKPLSDEEIKNIWMKQVYSNLLW